MLQVEINLPNLNGDSIKCSYLLMHAFMSSMGRCLAYDHWSAALTWGAILVARKSADLGHHLHQGLHILHYGALKLYRRSRARSSS